VRLAMVCVVAASLVAATFARANLGPTTEATRVVLELNNPVVRVISGDERNVTLPVAPTVFSGRTFVPLRGVLELFGAEVTWRDPDRVLIRATDSEVVLRIGRTTATVNGETRTLAAAPRIVAGRTLIPLRFVSEALGLRVTWHADTNTIDIARWNYRAVAQIVTVQVDNIARRLNVVEVPPDSNLRPTLGLGRGVVGNVEPLSSMAGQHGAVLGINGGYFQAYSLPHEPYTTLMHHGRLVHRGGFGSAVAFMRDGRVMMERVRVEVHGTTHGRDEWGFRWHCYFVNRTPERDSSAVVVFTPERGATIGLDFGVAIVVSNGRVVDVRERTDVAIPQDGYVIHLANEHNSLRGQFAMGTPVDFALSFTDDEHMRLDWRDAETIVGAGPLLVQAGINVANPAAEGFTEAKILSMSLNRSAIGLRADGTILLVTTPALTIRQLADAFIALGAVEAMALDGGGSSGLYFEDRYITRPGRQLSNALLFVPR